MVRFQCIHCGGKIAVPDRHMDRLARCPECGGVTHPLAHHLVSPDGSNATTKKTAPVDTGPSCSNCGMSLGKLQKPFEWNGQLVCGPCHRMLMLDANPPKPDAVTSVVAAPASEEVYLPPIPARRQPTEFALAIRTACLGLIITAIALYAIVSILQSVGYLKALGSDRNRSHRNNLLDSQRRDGVQTPKRNVRDLEHFSGW